MLKHCTHCSHSYHYIPWQSELQQSMYNYVYNTGIMHHDVYIHIDLCLPFLLANFASRDSRNVVGRSSQLYYHLPSCLAMSEFENKLQAFLEHYESMRASEGGDDADDLFNKEFAVRRAQLNAQLSILQ